MVQAPPAPQENDDILVTSELSANLRVETELGVPDAAKRRRCTKRDDFEDRDKGANILAGLKLWRNVISPAEEANLVATVRRWVGQGARGELMGRTYLAPRRVIRGKGRVTVQFGCCYNYARDSNGRLPGILPDEVVEPMPPELDALAERLVRWGVLPRSRKPDSAIVNIYSPGDCIPPHIDHHDFIRPFCTMSMLCTTPMVLGRRIQTVGDGDFRGTSHIMLEQRSVLVLEGNGADMAQHCIPSVAEERISITLRKIGPQHERAVYDHAEAAFGHTISHMRVR